MHESKVARIALIRLAGPGERLPPLRIHSADAVGLRIGYHGAPVRLAACRRQDSAACDVAIEVEQSAFLAFPAEQAHRRLAPAAAHLVCFGWMGEEPVDRLCDSRHVARLHAETAAVALDDLAQLREIRGYDRHPRGHVLEQVDRLGLARG